MTTINFQDDSANRIARTADKTARTSPKTLELASHEQQTSPKSIGPEESSKEKPDSMRSITGLHWLFVCLATFSANLLYGLDTTIAADIQGAISSTFNNTTQLGWLGIGFGLGSTVAILPIGKAYGMFNVKWVFCCSLFNFAAGSCLCGAAPSMIALIIGRVWAGAGGAGMYLGTINLIASIATPTEISFYFALEAFVYGTGCILGPIVGGTLADSKATWRWAFYLNLVIFAIMSPIYVFALPSIPRQSDITFSARIKKLDWLGIVLTAAMYTCFILAFTFGGALWTWKDGRFIALSALSIVFAVVFAVTQYYAVLTNKTDRLFACEFVGNPQLVLLYIAMACGGATQFITTYYIPLYFLFVNGDTGTEAAIRLLPFICCYVVATLTCGYVMPRLGYHMVWYLVSGLLMATGGVAMYTIDTDTPASHTYGFSVLLGFGLTVSQAGYGLGTQLADSGRAPDVIQFMNMSQGQSATLGLTIASAIFQSESFIRLQRVLSSQGFSDPRIHAAIAGSHSEVLKLINPELKKQCLAIIVRAIRLNWVLVIAAGSLQTIVSLCMSKKRF